MDEKLTQALADLLAKSVDQVPLLVAETARAGMIRYGVWSLAGLFLLAGTAAQVLWLRRRLAKADSHRYDSDEEAFNTSLAAGAFITTVAGVLVTLGSLAAMLSAWAAPAAYALSVWTGR